MLLFGACFCTQKSLSAETEHWIKGGKAREKGKRYWVIGKKVPGCQIRAPARNDKGGRPYNSERAALYVRAGVECRVLGGTHRLEKTTRADAGNKKASR